MPFESKHLKSPFPWFGGKFKVSEWVWSALGDVTNYVEPFFGSGAVYLNRPHPHHIATINDKDGYVCNFWRAMQADPDGVARMADYPVIENDLHARHYWLIKRKDKLVERLEGDPDYYDAKIAAWWCWGLCCWIGSGWCSGNGAWNSVDGKLIKRPHLGNGGKGVNRQLPHLGNGGKGVNRQLPHLGDGGKGVKLQSWFQLLSEKLGKARICCGEWNRVCGMSPTFNIGLTGIFLDPPYSHSLRDNNLYNIETDCAHEVLEWCKDNGNNPLLRIVLAGYVGEHDILESMGWRVKEWKSHGGYGNQSKVNDNNHKERLWFSPNCIDIKDSQTLLF